VGIATDGFRYPGETHHHQQRRDRLLRLAAGRIFSRTTNADRRIGVYNNSPQEHLQNTSKEGRQSNSSDWSTKRKRTSCFIIDTRVAGSRINEVTGTKDSIDFYEKQS
jgi:hypothetical protein